MDWQESLKSILENLVVTESDWKFVTSGSLEVTVGTPIAQLGINGEGGVIHLKRDSDAEVTKLSYGGLGGAAGVSLLPIPGGFSFSITDMPSRGRVYKLPRAGRTLSKNEFYGTFVMFEIAADAGPGISGALMFLGGSWIAAAVAGSLTFGTMQIPAFVASARACVAFGGVTATALPYNANVNAMIGRVF